MRTVLQVEYVVMENQQDDAYREAIEEYRSASQARVAKSSDTNLSNNFRVLPRRQISNYFVQFRKVHIDFPNSPCPILFDIIVCYIYICGYL